MPAVSFLASQMRHRFPEFVWLRTAAVAVLLATIVAAVMIAGQERRFRVHAELHITPAGEGEASRDEHLGDLLSGLTSIDVSEESSSGPNRVHVGVLESPSGESIRLSVETITDVPEHARARLDAWMTQYVADYESRFDAAPPEPAVWVEHRKRIAEYEAAEEEVAALIDELSIPARGAAIERRANLADALAQRQESWDQARTVRRAAADALDALLAAETPAGVLRPDELAAAEAQASNLLEERKALHLRLLDVHRELNRALVETGPAVTNLRAALESLNNVLTEQRKADHEFELAATLERLSVIVADYRAAVDEFLSAWKRETKHLSRPHDHADAERLLTRQSSLESLAVDYRLATDPWNQSLNQLVESVAAEGPALTRRLVIQNALRGPLHAVQSAAERVRGAVSTVVTPESFRLDNACRLASGLARRVRELREEVTADLQRLADERAAADHAARIEEARRELTRRADEQDAALVTLVEAVQEFVELDPPYVAAVESRGRLAAARERLTTVREMLERIRAHKPLTEAAPPVPDQLDYRSAEIEWLPADPPLLQRVVVAMTLVIAVTFLLALTISFRTNDSQSELSSRL